MTSKKIWIIFSLCIMLISMGNLTFANKFSENETVTMTNPMTGVSGQYVPVNLMMSGEDVISDVPAILYVNGNNTRTLVPVSFIVDRMGADIAWNGDTREITIKTSSKTIVMQIDNAYASVNGTRTKLPDGIAPMLLNFGQFNKTFVPVKFISDQLGLDVNWIGETQTVAINKAAQTLTNVYLDYMKQFPEIRLKVSGEVDTNSYVISGSDVGEQDKIVVDLQNTKFNLTDTSMVKNGVGVYKVGDGIFGIDRVEIQSTGTNPNTTRATVYLDEKKGYRVFYDASTKEMVIQLINTINEVNYESLYGTDTVRIETSERPSYNINLVGDKIYVDIFNGYLKASSGDTTIVPVNKGKIQSFSYSQMDTSKYGSNDIYTSSDVITRVTVSLNESVTYDDIYIEDNGTDILVFVAQNPLNNFEYVRLNDAKSNLNIKLFETAEVTKSYDSSSRTLTVKVPMGSTSLNDFTYPVDDNIIKSVKIGTSGNQYVVSIELIENTTYVDSSVGKNVVFAFTNKTILDSNFKDRLIVIDAGHGGHDPGAVGSQAKEKDIALKAALSLEKQLKQLGFKVYMTRSKDEYIGLYDRADIANDLNADLFISIHINASTSADAKGVEVLYNSDSMSGGKGLATLIQKELVSDLGATNRGIVQRPNLVVLRETEMPSVLCELGFISNASEQAKLMDSAYIDKATGAIVDGIQAFLK